MCVCVCAGQQLTSDYISVFMNNELRFTEEDALTASKPTTGGFKLMAEWFHINQLNQW